MKSMDAVFVFFDFFGKFIYHLGQSYIVANLRKNGYQADCFVTDSYMTIEEVADEIAKYNPKIVGFSIYDYNFFLTKELARVLRKKLPDQTVIVAGGPTATFSVQKVLDFIPEVDICNRFAGEEVILDLLKCILNKEDYHHLDGISYRNQYGELINNPVVNLKSDLDEYPSPYLEQVIDIPKCQRVNQIITVVTSRGCVFSCRYCNFAAIGQHGIKFNSINRVIDELKVITKYASGYGTSVKLEFMDDIFTINRTRTIELCQRIIDEKINIDFSCQTRADCLDEEVIQYLYKAGCRRIFIGLESGVPRILNSMGKADPIINTTFEKEKDYISKLEDAVRTSVELKIDTTVNMIFGWPGETKEEAFESLKIVEQMNPTHYSHSNLTYYAGTELYMNARKQHKQVIEAHESQFPMTLNYTVNNLPQIYGYNLRELPHLKNDLYLYAMTHRRSIIQVIMGVGFMKEEIPQVFLTDNKSISFSWMVNNLGTNIKVHIFKEDQPNHLMFYYPSNAFSVECFDGYEINRLENAETLEHRLRISGAEAYNKTYDEKICVELKNNEDLDKFIDKVENMNLTELLEKSSHGSNDYMITDYCRWCHENECPAIGLKRIIVKDGYVYTCLNGEPIMKLEDFDLEEAREIVQKKFKDVCASRGCDTCEVKDRCPKCMYISQFGQESYCRYHYNKNKYKNLKKLHKAKMLEYFYIP